MSTYLYKNSCKYLRLVQFVKKALKEEKLSKMQIMRFTTLSVFNENRFELVEYCDGGEHKVKYLYSVFTCLN